MDRSEWRSFKHWLNTANERELNARKKDLRAVRDDFDSAEVRGEAARCIRLIEEEQLARAAVRRYQVGRHR